MITLYKCEQCGWIGEMPIELAGYLWDYTNYDACPKCWENDAIDTFVEIEYYAYTPQEFRDLHIGAVP